MRSLWGLFPFLVKMMALGNHLLGRLLCRNKSVTCTIWHSARVGARLPGAWVCRKGVSCTQMLVLLWTTGAFWIMRLDNLFPFLRPQIWLSCGSPRIFSVVWGSMGFLGRVTTVGVTH